MKSRKNYKKSLAFASSAPLQKHKHQGWEENEADLEPVWQIPLWGTLPWPSWTHPDDVMHGVDITVSHIHPDGTHGEAIVLPRAVDHDGLMGTGRRSRGVPARRGIPGGGGVRGQGMGRHGTAQWRNSKHVCNRESSRQRWACSHPMSMQCALAPRASRGHKLRPQTKPPILRTVMQQSHTHVYAGSLHGLQNRKGNFSFCFN